MPDLNTKEYKSYIVGMFHQTCKICMTEVNNFTCFEFI